MVLCLYISCNYACSFSKALWLSQSVCTLLYLINGLAVYLLVGDATWLDSPVTVSMQQGLAKDICQVFVVLYFSLAIMVDGTIFVQNIQKILQPNCVCTLSNCLRGRGNLEDQGLRQAQVHGYGTSTSEQDLKMTAASADADKPFKYETSIGSPGERHEHDISPRDESPIKSFFLWLLWCVLAIGVAIVVTMFLSDLDDVLGLTAALIASQAVVSWPAFFHYWLFKRSRPKSISCYFHGNGTDPCLCDEPNAIPVREGMIVGTGIVLLIFGVWSNFVDAAEQLNKDRHGIMACANPLRAAKSLASNIFSDS